MRRIAIRPTRKAAASTSPTISSRATRRSAETPRPARMRALLAAARSSRAARTSRPRRSTTTTRSTSAASRWSAAATKPRRSAAARSRATAPKHSWVASIRACSSRSATARSRSTVRTRPKLAPGYIAAIGLQNYVTAPDLQSSIIANNDICAPARPNGVLVDDPYDISLYGTGSDHRREQSHHHLGGDSAGRYAARRSRPAAARRQRRVHLDSRAAAQEPGDRHRQQHRRRPVRPARTVERARGRRGRRHRRVRAAEHRPDAAGHQLRRLRRRQPARHRRPVAKWRRRRSFRARLQHDHAEQRCDRDSAGQPAHDRTRRADAHDRRQQSRPRAIPFGQRHARAAGIEARQRLLAGVFVRGHWYRRLPRVGWARARRRRRGFGLQGSVGVLHLHRRRRVCARHRARRFGRLAQQLRQH